MIALRGRSVWVVLAVLAGLTALSGLGGRQDDAGDTSPARSLDAPTAELLEALTVGPETDSASYDRDRFGAGWRSGPDGCDTRDRVLAAESVTLVDRQGCTIVAGEWVSAWDGAHVVDPAALDVDHLVPLAEAWTSGASTWDQARREAFANDLDPARPDALVAVTAGANRAKGDADPAEWMPPRRDVSCRYATAWITQKHAWRLTVDPAEHQALADVLATCPQEAGR